MASNSFFKIFGEKNLRKKIFLPYIVTKTIEGQTFRFYIGNETGEDWYVNKSTDPIWIEMRFIRDNLLQYGDTILECGAHHGCTTILLSRWTGTRGRVIALEPNPENFSILEKNISLNRLTNIKTKMAAVGPSEGHIHLTNISNSSVTFNNGGFISPMIPLDNFDWSNPGLIKIDVEGFELEVLQGARKVLAKKPNLAIEIHGQILRSRGISVEDILSQIGEGYRFWIQWKDSQYPKLYGDETIYDRVHLFAIHRQSQNITLSQD